MAAHNLTRAEAREAIDHAVVARGLGRSIDGRPILRNIDLSVPIGSTLALLGANGAGKSTLLSLLATLNPPTEGELLLFGESVKAKAASLRAQIGMIAHRPMLYRDLTLFENLTFFGGLYRVADTKDRAWQLLERVGLAHRAHDRVGTLSQGMTQRVAIARALMHRPKLLLADEPYAGLDIPSADVIAQLLQQLHEEGATIIVSVHDMVRACEVSQQIMVLRRGEVAWQGNTAATDVEGLRREVSTP